MSSDNVMEKVININLKDCERQPCEVWTRVMGYFRPTSEFNCGKKAEFVERKYFQEKKAAGCACDDRESYCTGR